MSDRELHFKAAEGGKDFVGIRYLKNGIEVHYPETFRWNCDIKDGFSLDALTEDVIAGIRMILSSISFAKTFSQKKTNQFDASDGEEPFALKSYLWIMQDFFQNGSYKNREMVYKTNQRGRINWKRTMAKLPMYSDGSFIYKDFVVSTKSQADNLLVEIHRFCVQKSVFLAGWLYGIRSAAVGVRSLKDVELSNAMKKRYCYAIQYELDHTFDDDKRLRLKHMLNVINGLNKSENGQLVYGVDSYHYVFEALVDSVFGTEKELKNYNPGGTWSNNHPISSLRIDTLLRKDDVYLVVDAKCYRYADEGYTKGNTGGLPAIDSVQKQITYGDSVLLKTKKEGISANVFNCFILPYDKEKTYGANKATSEFLHDANLYAVADWRKNKYDYEKIHVFFVDLRDLLEKTQESNHSKEQSDLLEMVKIASARNPA